MMNTNRDLVTHDWLGLKVNSNNKITGHHIVKIEDGGVDSPDNMAALSILGHRYLHEFIEKDSIDYYNLLNNEFLKLNNDRYYPTVEELNNIKNIILNYEKEYYRNIKKRINGLYINTKLAKYIPADISIMSPEGYKYLITNGIDPIKGHKPNVYKKRWR